MTDPLALAWVALAGLYAGAQNALAGGGSFITFPALLLAGLDPLSANITSTVALFPSQVTSALAGRRLVSGVGRLRFWQLFLISVAGGAVGAGLLLHTPVATFSFLVPWFVLFATLVFAWGSFLRKGGQAAKPLPLPLLVAAQSGIAVYGGYFGGGIGILMLAALTLAGQPVRQANAGKNVLAMAMNASAVAVFVASSRVVWPAALALGAGGIAGGLLGAWLMHRLPESLMRGFVVCVGLVLTLWLFIR
ncbi:sulfite exporter TauE/SafE family protein [Paludibacterium paludis]|uniref:Probable membrane transporter protein n=1 Tax=Paludibacterium paludis TaxID=1225769 RepID=A0A918NYS6_9NEIS|nr:sulfite exporter TauE/SafE family protein [Paludibacterium paludis]GGY04952.1 UPF0721 transmembrane protein [Paludibacterium paludis]